MKRFRIKVFAYNPVNPYIDSKTLRRYEPRRFQKIENHHFKKKEASMVIMELKNLDRKLRYDIEIFMVKKSWVVNEGRADEFINYLEEKITKDELFKYTEYREEEGAN